MIVQRSGRRRRSQALEDYLQLRRSLGHDLAEPPGCDELGYLPLPAEAASALFQVVAQRYTRTSIILTTNRGVGAWGEVLGDTTVAAALLDQLLHRSVVLDTTGESYLVLQGQMYGRASLTCDDASPESRRPGISPRSSPVVLTGLRPSPTRHAVVGFRFSGRLAQGPAVRLADRRHPPRLDMLTMTRSAYLQVRCAVVAQVERAVLTLHPPLRGLGSQT